MPIASGARGRVDVGVDTNITWTPDGFKRKTKPVNRNSDSYLERYWEIKQSQTKKNLMEVTQDNTDPNNHESDGANEEVPQTDGGSEENSSRNPSNGERSKLSRLCVIL